MKQSSDDVKALHKFADAAIKAGQAIATLAVAYARVGAQLVELIWEAYRRAGSPYGDTPEGLKRWVNERLK